MSYTKVESAASLAMLVLTLLLSGCWLMGPRGGPDDGGHGSAMALLDDGSFFVAGWHGDTTLGQGEPGEMELTSVHGTNIFTARYAP